MPSQTVSTPEIIILVSVILCMMPLTIPCPEQNSYKCFIHKLLSYSVNSVVEPQIISRPESLLTEVAGN